MFFVLLICTLSINRCAGQQNHISVTSPINYEPNQYHGAVRTVYEDVWKWPWLGSFVSRQEKQFFCAGTLISIRRILSAAHCFHPKQSDKINPDDVLAYLGKPDFNVRLDYEIESSIADFIIHPGWKPSSQSFDADIAIAVLAKDIVLSDSVYHVGLPYPSIAVNFLGHLVGWGRSEDSDPNNPYDHEKIAKELPSKAVSNEDCFLDFPNLVEISSRRTFCAGWPGFEANACHGDSGSGYFVKVGSFWTVQGIVSSSPVHHPSGKCIVNQYAIFTKVSEFTVWISEVGKNADVTPTQSVNVRCEFLSMNGQGACLLKNIEISKQPTKISPKLLPIQCTKQLSIDDSSVPAVPFGLRDIFPELQVLNITRSFLSSVARKSVAGLTEINFSLNNLQELNISVFWDCPKLRVLKLDFNKISNLHEILFIYSPELEEFSANNNRIGSLHRDLFRENPRLKKVSLAGNVLHHIKLDFFNLASIIEIDLRENFCINVFFKPEKGGSPANLKFQQEIVKKCQQ